MHRNLCSASVSIHSCPSSVGFAPQRCTFSIVPILRSNLYLWQLLHGVQWSAILAEEGIKKIADFYTFRVAILD